MMKTDGSDMLNALCDAIQESKRIVFLGGAGVSTESGIPDFRSENGIFDALSKYGEPPEVLLSVDYFYRHPETFYEYYRSSLLVTDKAPNNAHKALAKLEEAGKLTAVVTQNIDGLHQMAGSEAVYELHGSIYRNHCEKCGKKFTGEYVKDKTTGVPKCECGGIIKPDVVLYGEALDDTVVRGAVTKINDADMLIVGGTSLVVYPAAGLINYFHGNTMTLINKSTTSYDRHAQIVLHEPIGETLFEVLTRLKMW